MHGKKNCYPEDAVMVTPQLGILVLDFNPFFWFATTSNVSQKPEVVSAMT